MMQQCGELLLLPFLRCSTHALQPLGQRGPPCVGRMCGCRSFSLVPGLPSRLSAVGCPPLFEPFIGTTPESDSWPAPLWVVRLSPSPTALPPDCAADADQASRFSCMMFPDVRGVSDCAGSPVDFVLARISHRPCTGTSPDAANAGVRTTSTETECQAGAS
jgi:hypothetical protein